MKIERSARRFDRSAEQLDRSDTQFERSANHIEGCGDQESRGWHQETGYSPLDIFYAPAYIHIVAGKIVWVMTPPVIGSRASSSHGPPEWAASSFRIRSITPPSSSGSPVCQIREKGESHVQKPNG